MAVLKTSQTILTLTTLTAGTTSSFSTAVDLTKAAQFILVLRGALNTAASSGAKVTLWPSHNGTDYDTEAWLDWTINPSAADASGNFQKHSAPISPVAKYIKCKVENLDSTYDISNLELICTTQRMG